MQPSGFDLDWRTPHEVFSNSTFFWVGGSTGPDEQCDLLVLAIPFGLIRDIVIDSRIRTGFTTEKNMAIDKIVQADNGKVQLEFGDRYWDMIRKIHGQEVHMSGRAYSNPNGFISSWEVEPGNPSTLGLLVDYTGGFAGRILGRADYFGIASPVDVNRILGEWENILPGIGAKYTGNALVSDWGDQPLAWGAFVSPMTNTVTVWWRTQWEIQGNIFFAGEAYDEEYWSYMNGAILSGERVAKEIHML